jgi:hypothetical protein
MRRYDDFVCCVETADICEAFFASRTGIEDIACIAMCKDRWNEGNGNKRIFKDAKHQENYEYEYHEPN